MGNPSIQLSKKQVIEALVQFTPRELNGIIKTLFKQKSFAPPTVEEITQEAGKVIKRGGLKPGTAKEAVKWARSKK
jgi:hypothetical protein